MEKFNFITRAHLKPLLEPTRWFDAEFLGSVDTELLELLEKIDAGTPLYEVGSLVADLCDSKTHSDRPDKRVGVEKNVLLMPNWRETWQHGGDVQWMFFTSVVGLKSLSELDHLYELFRQLVCLVVDGETDVLREEIAHGDLLRALRGYLSLRGYDVATRTSGDWVPSKLQRRILEVLDGVASTADKLEGALDVSRSTLYGNKKTKKGGLTELMELGKVANDRGIGGYYRPDSPPKSN